MLHRLPQLTPRIKCMGLLYACFCLLMVCSSSRLAAQNITIGEAGPVTIELITADAFFSNTLSLISATGPGETVHDVGIAFSGCRVKDDQDATFPGLHLLSEKLDVRGCQVALDSDQTTPEIDPFPAQTVFEFNMCAQIDADTDCDYVWSTDQTKNNDNFNHVRVTDIHAENEHVGTVFHIDWEDEQNGGDMDFNDLEVNVRVERDSDGDGLWDDWETHGIDTNGDGTPNLILPDADVTKKDLYVELDYMDCLDADGMQNVVEQSTPAETELEVTACSDNHTHKPPQDVIDRVVQVFANADVVTETTNPMTGEVTTTTGITLHLELGNPIRHEQYLSLACHETGSVEGTNEVVGDFNNIKSQNEHFGADNARRFAYRYGIMGHLQSPDTRSSGCGEIGGNDFLVTLFWRAMRAEQNGMTFMDADNRKIMNGTEDQQVGTILHELGHALNLRHGGGDGTNHKPNYLSVMNYFFQMKGIPLDSPTDTTSNRRVFDYSRNVLDSLDETALNEMLGVRTTTHDPTLYTNYYCPGSTSARRRITNSMMNWNCRDGFESSPVRADINGDGAFTTLSGYDDWDNIQYGFHRSADFEDGVHSTTVGRVEDPPDDVEVATSSDRIVDVVDSYILEGNYPNPFQGQTTIQYAAPVPSHVKLVVFDVLGQEVQVLVDQMVAAGNHTTIFDGSKLPSGVYFYRLETNQKMLTRSMMLVK